VLLAITATVITCSVALHVLSRKLASELQENASISKHPTALVEQIEWLTYDARVKLGAALNDTRNTATNMAALFFDDSAFEQINNGAYSIYLAPATNQESADQLQKLVWPWPRFIHGQIVRELKAEGATAVGFDIMFPDLKRDFPWERVQLPDGRLAASDEFFAEEMKTASNVVLAVDSNTIPALLFQTNAASLASIASRPDYAVLRRVKPFNTVRLWHPLLRGRVKSLGLLLDKAKASGGKLVIPRKLVEDTHPDALEIPLNANGSMKMTSDGDIDFGGDSEPPGPKDQFPFVEKRIWNLGIQLAAQALKLDLDHAEVLQSAIVLRGPNGLSRTLPLDGAGYFYINWSLRFDDLKEGKTPVYFGQLGEVLINDYGRTHNGQNLGNKFKNKIVLIGSVAKGNNVTDMGATPLDPQTPLVTKHLNIANSIITGRFVERTSLPVEVLLIVVLGCISSLLTWRLRVLVASIAVAGLSLSYVLFTTWMYVDYRYWIPMVMPLAGGLILPHFSLVTYRVIFEQREQRRVRGIFSKIVSPDVAQELLSAERLSLGGERRKITVFFADVRGFTEFTDATQQTAEEFVRENQLGESESKAYFDQIAAEQLETVNLYLGRIADTIKKHNGTLDKYMGDCVMAFWGAPVSNERHAVDCAHAAIEAQRQVYALNQERFAENERRKKQNEIFLREGSRPVPMLPLLALGTGINTGYATVGLMGSDTTVLNYTVFGREVNLASRLEGASGRGRIFIGGSTFEEIKRVDPVLAVICVRQNPITPKGFRHEVDVYEVPWKLAAASSPSPAPSPAVLGEAAGV
jgi:adenylate cyclase